ncbi:hypothetical protein FIBSPDRAFT_907821 [Athelia psychrophila]|uniref:Uncharacterized protein n=1 Tax=Athelia psychrophila TaxID=1759441 RepID=A0A166U2K6_9AGAM|nr:hypothetical protein FIBSPDRAFT_907821 [Fibularhizoctonia sp. CBS 109695]
MMQKGQYTVGMRMLARAFTKSGCSQGLVGPMIRLAGSVIGVKVQGKMSRRTVSRSIREGGVASTVQLGHELAQAKSFTTSCDGTSHKHVSYDARHFAYKIPVNRTSETLRPVVRVMSVSASINHTAETQFQNMDNDFGVVRTTYGASPLGQRSEAKLTEVGMAKKDAGGNGDHAPDQKLQHKKRQDKKERVIEMDLGSQYLLALGPDALIDVLHVENQQKIADAGGELKWGQLSTGEQITRDVTMMKRLTVRLGKEELAAMPEGDRRKLMLFIWAGCSMHKELNTVKCGNKAMMNWWKKNNIPGPIPLANRDNAASLRDMADDPPDDTGDDPPDDMGMNTEVDIGQAIAVDHSLPTKAQQRAMDVTSAGGVKAASIAGAILNHKDDKKGQQDTYRMYFKSILGRSCNFPDTSNTRYHCYCAAAAELIAYTPEYIHFLEVVKMAKEKPGFNNMELNLWRALQDSKTKSELAVLTVYLNTVSAPYAKFIRGPGTETINMLDLGPYHYKLKAHIKKLINNPSLAIGPDARAYTATLDGDSWHHEDAMAAVLAQREELPYLQELFVAFMEEALVTWERFTAEFDYGGLIDTATQEEKDLAWMPTTNDANEGRLGGWRLFARTNPSSTIEQYNSIAKFWKNETQGFMDEYFIPEDHQYVMREARAQDASGATAIREAAQVAALDAAAAENTAKLAEKQARKAKEATRVQAIQIVTDRDVIRKMLGKAMDEQLDAHRARDKKVPIKAHVKKKIDKEAALMKALDRLEGIDVEETS